MLSWSVSPPPPRRADPCLPAAALRTTITTTPPRRAGGSLAEVCRRPRRSGDCGFLQEASSRVLFLLRVESLPSAAQTQTPTTARLRRRKAAAFLFASPLLGADLINIKTIITNNSLCRLLRAEEAAFIAKDTLLSREGLAAQAPLQEPPPTITTTPPALDRRALLDGRGAILLFPSTTPPLPRGESANSLTQRQGGQVRLQTRLCAERGCCSSKNTNVAEAECSAKTGRRSFSSPNIERPRPSLPKTQLRLGRRKKIPRWQSKRQTPKSSVAEEGRQKIERAALLLRVASAFPNIPINNALPAAALTRWKKAALLGERVSRGGFAESRQRDEAVRSRLAVLRLWEMLETILPGRCWNTFSLLFRTWQASPPLEEKELRPWPRLPSLFRVSYSETSREWISSRWRLKTLRRCRDKSTVRKEAALLLLLLRRKRKRGEKALLGGWLVCRKEASLHAPSPRHASFSRNGGQWPTRFRRTQASKTTILKKDRKRIRQASSTAADPLSWLCESPLALKDLLVCAMHEHNPSSDEFAEYAKHKMELEFKRLLRMRQAAKTETLPLAH